MRLPPNADGCRRQATADSPVFSDHATRLRSNQAVAHCQAPYGGCFMADRGLDATRGSSQGPSARGSTSLGHRSECWRMRVERFICLREQRHLPDLDITAQMLTVALCQRAGRGALQDAPATIVSGPSCSAQRGRCPGGHWGLSLQSFTVADCGAKVMVILRPASTGTSELGLELPPLR
jgi:hypothetical protein